MNNIIHFPKRESSVNEIKYLYKLHYLEDDDSLWTSMQNAKTKEWGEWVKIGEGFLYGDKK